MDEESRLIGGAEYVAEDDPPVSLPGKLAVCVAYFNPAGFARRRVVFEQFRDAALKQGADLWIIEASCNGGWEVDKCSGVHVVRLRMRDILWQKERMLNVLIDTLPADYDKVAWVDADLLFNNPNWVADTAEVLTRLPVVQCFTRAMQLDKVGTPAWWSESDGHGVEYRNALSIGLTAHPGNPLHWATMHPGFAWAARRDVIEAAGRLYDQNVTGSGDVVMALGFLGYQKHPYYGRLPAPLLRAAKDWGYRAAQVTGGRLGCVVGVVRHLWHGARENRNYNGRHSMLSGNGFSLDHLRIGENGLWEWTDTAPDNLRETLKGFFDGRREDG